MKSRLRHQEERREKRDQQRRAMSFGLAATAVAVFLLGRLAQIQLVQGSRWQELGQGQRVRLVAVPAPRGNIYDRNGGLLAGNRAVFTVSLVYTGEPLPEEAVLRLSQILQMPPSDIREAEKLLRPAYGRPFAPVPLKVNIDERTHTLLEEYRHELPGVVVEAAPMRTYAGLASHVIGYVRRPDRGAGAVGAYGLELSYNGDPQGLDAAELGLQGLDGLRQVEVDAQGRPVRVLREKPPVQGNSLVLTLDAGLQRVAEEALARRMEEIRRLRTQFCPRGCEADWGALVALDPRNGQVLAMASVPAFDPAAFAALSQSVPGSGEARAFQRLWEEWQRQRGRPLYNHATMEALPPGSTFKPVTALAALAAGVTNPRERIVCTGGISYGGIRFADWAVHGSVNLESALARSCNVYFYTMGMRLRIEGLAGMARRLGLGSKTGLEARDGIPEVAGWVASPETKRARHPREPVWYRSENLSAAIGQADNQFTPLQMAVMAATLANGGTRYRPYVVRAVLSPDGGVLRAFEPQVEARVPLDPEDLDAVRKGMLAVTRPERGGTAAAAFADFPRLTKERLGREILVAGKTGTAETGIKGETPYGWFIAFAPFDKPEIAVAGVVRHGGGGSMAVAPVVRAMLDQYFGLNRAVAGTVAGSVYGD